MFKRNSTVCRRKLLKSLAAGSGAVIAGKSLPESWIKPVIDTVMLPAHAVTTDDGGPTTAQDVTTAKPPTPPVTKPPVTEPSVPEPNSCPDGETQICHNPTKHRITKCQADDSIKDHLDHGDYLGLCVSGK